MVTCTPRLVGKCRWHAGKTGRGIPEGACLRWECETAKLLFHAHRGSGFEIWRSMNQPSMNAKKDRPDFVLQAWTMCAVAAGARALPPAHAVTHVADVGLALALCVHRHGIGAGFHTAGRGAVQVRSGDFAPRHQKMTLFYSKSRGPSRFAQYVASLIGRKGSPSRSWRRSGARLSRHSLKPFMLS